MSNLVFFLQAHILVVEIREIPASHNAAIFKNRLLHMDGTKTGMKECCEMQICLSGILPALKNVEH